MAVTTAYQLPEQPVSGGLEFIPLGGNGWTAPHSAYSIHVNSVGDASGGSNQCYIRFDPRYTQLVSFVAIGFNGASADVPYRAELRCSNEEQTIVGGDMAYTPITGFSGTDTNLLWTPPPLLCSAAFNSSAQQPPYVRVIVANADSTSLSVTVRLYNYDKRARELMPINVLLASLPRGSNIA